MRVVENAALQTMHSPVRCLFLSLHKALGNIASEKVEEFDRLHPEFTLEYVDTHLWVLSVNDEKVIKISTFVIEFLWVTAYAHFVFYTRIVQGNHFDKHTEIDLGEDPDVAIAMSLLSWGVEKLINQEELNWPNGLPKPVMKPGFASDEDVADEIALGAAACLLHHELAHMALGHTGGGDIDNEKDADLHTWDWVIGDRRDFEASDLSKRLLALVHAYSVGIIADVHREGSIQICHPRSIDRLFFLLGHFNISANHKAYAFAFATIHLHLEATERRLPVQTAAYDSFYESFSDVICHISAFPTLMLRNTGRGDCEMRKEIGHLQSALALVDQLTRGSPVGSGTIEFLVLKMEKLNIKIKMYQEIGHHRPHLHIDYGATSHVASYAIDNAERLEGNLPRKYDRTVMQWIEKHRVKLTELWTVAQAGAPIEELVLAIQSE